MGTRNSIPASTHKQQNNCIATSLHLPFQAIAHIMNLDFRYQEEKVSGKRQQNNNNDDNNSRRYTEKYY